MRKMMTPSLPAWPPLWFDEEKKRAMVHAQFPTWRGYEIGLTTTKILILLNIPVCLVIAWQLSPDFDQFVFKLIVWMLFWATLYTLTVRWMTFELPGLLSRQFFKTAARFWFTKDAIAFKSKLYEKAVIQARRVGESEVKLDFTVAECPAAKWTAAAGLDPSRQDTKGHFERARRLNLVVSGTGGQSRLSSSGSLIRKSIPVCEIQDYSVDQLAVVCNAALMLTEEPPEHHFFSDSSGVDIDEQ